MSVSTVLRLVAMIVAVGAIALAANQYQWSGFQSTIAESQQGSAVISELDRSLIEVIRPMFKVLYRRDGVRGLPANMAAYDRARTRITAAFDAGASELAGTPVAAPLAAARETWESVDATVLASPQDWPTEELYASLLRRVDPWLPTVWDQLNTLDLQLAETRAALARHTVQHSEEVWRLQQLVGPTVLGAIVVAIAMALLTVWRISRRVLSPLAQVGWAAQRIHHSDDFTEVQVPTAVAEVQDLAQIVNESAANLRDQHAMLKQRARTDPLTGLPNRDALSEVLETMLGRSWARVSVLFVDLDDFKSVNDTFGHAVGDAVLREVADRLAVATRSCEVVARVGGDEFAVALDTSQDAAAPVAVAERIHLALEQPVDLGAHEVEVGCSIGIVTAEPYGASVDALLRRADAAMYMAKSHGKGRSEVYSATTHNGNPGVLPDQRSIGRF